MDAVDESAIAQDRGLDGPGGGPRRSWRRILLYFFGALCLGEILFFLWTWPDWEAMRAGRIPASALIKEYEAQRSDDPKLPPLRWMPQTRKFPKAVQKPFVIAEDSRFYEHGGIDVQALEEAIDYNYRHGKLLIGASTISQQTAKNMFLSLSRSPLRKWHELLLTFWLEAELSKAEILHVYLNVAEFGTGIFGLEAAARAYYHVGAQQLTAAQAIELAASLPSPKKNNPKTRTRSFQKRVQRIAHTMNAIDRYAEQSRGIDKAAAAAELQKKLDELRREMDESPPEPASAADHAPADAPTEGAAGSFSRVPDGSEKGPEEGSDTMPPTEDPAPSPAPSEGAAGSSPVDTAAPPPEESQP